MAGGFARKSLILEQKCLTKSGETSTKPAPPSTKPAFSSTKRFWLFGLFSLSFSFVNKEEEEEKAIHQKGRSIHQRVFDATAVAVHLM